MSFNDVLGHAKPIELLRRAVQKDKMAQSYLFVGNEGIGKKWVALQFAKFLNCLDTGREPQDACDQCVSCRKIEDRVHPDVLLLEPEGQTLKVDQVRQMQRDLAYRPYEGKYRICILSAADRMAPNMSNTLLKTLEEPPRRTLLILLANSPRLLLPTILSRCQPIRFSPLPISVVTGWLTDKKGLEPPEAHLLASLSEGSIGKALEIREEIREVPRRELFESLVGLPKVSFEKRERVLEALPSQRESLLLILEVMKTLVRDLLITKIVRRNPVLIHGDLRSPMEKLASTWTLPALLKRIETLHRTALAVRSNANTTLALEAMMLSWAEG
jgi:DNA polymerase-3 subunit delta'